MRECEVDCHLVVSICLSRQRNTHEPCQSGQLPSAASLNNSNVERGRGFAKTLRRTALTTTVLPVVQARGAISGHALVRVPRSAPTAAHARPSGRSRARLTSHQPYVKDLGTSPPGPARSEQP